MKKSYFFVIAMALFACNSEFSFDQAQEEFGQDEDGDPVIINPIDDPNRTFGQESSYCYGFSEPDPSYQKSEIEIGADMPEAHDLSEYLPEVRSQGKQGSCTAWATGYYLKSFQENYQEKMMGLATTDFAMSPAFVFNQINEGDCYGSRIDSALVLLADQGIVPWLEMPYTDEKCDALPTEDQVLLASEFRIQEFRYLDGEFLLEQTKAHLLKDQPVVIALSIDRSYFGAREEDGTAVYRKFKNGNSSHAMLIVGYDDQKNAFKAVNSWGKSWGNDGFVWVDYKAFQNVMDVNDDFKVICEAWVSDDLAFEAVPGQSLSSSSR